MASNGVSADWGTPEFRDLVDSLAVLVWVSDADGACLFFGKPWYSFTGQKPEEALGMGWAEAVHPDDRERVRLAFAEARREACRYQIEYRLRGRHGEYKWMLDFAAPRFSRTGELIGYVGCLADNQERKLAELSLKRSERTLDIATQAGGLGIWSWNRGSDRLAFSNRAREIFGLGDADATPSMRFLAELVFEEDKPHAIALRDRALDPSIRSREPYRYRIRRASDGAVRWVRAYGEAIFEEGPPARAVEYIGTFEDITDQVAAEARLAEHEERLRLALEAADLAVWELDATSDTVTVSPELNLLYGFPPDARPTADDYRARYAPGEQERAARLAAEAAARGETKLKIEVKHVWPDGTVKWLLIQAQLTTPFPNGHTRVIGVAMDITERKLAQERLEVIARELRHRVKNSLSVAQTLARHSIRGGRTVEEGLTALDHRLQSYARAADVIMRPDGMAADLAELVTVVVAPYREAERDPIRILGGPVQDLPERLAASLGMALHELCTNAIKYGALSVPSGHVDIGWTCAGGSVALTWREFGGPAVAPPANTGFGMRLLREALFSDGAGTVDFDFGPDGLVCCIRMEV